MVVRAARDGDEEQAKSKGQIVLELALSLMASSALQTLSQRPGSIEYTYVCSNVLVRLYKLQSSGQLSTFHRFHCLGPGPLPLAAWTGSECSLCIEVWRHDEFACRLPVIVCMIYTSCSYGVFEAIGAAWRWR